jgi:predicted amidohydrolase YtcJ
MRHLVRTPTATVARLWGILLIAGASSGGAASPSSRGRADLVLEHGTVLTVDTKDDIATAVAIRDGRIVAVGDERGISRWIGRGTRVIDLAGRTATPGLIDSHAHIMDGGLTELYALDLTRTGSVAELLRALKARADAAPPGSWISGAGWNEDVLAEHRAPTLSELDGASGSHPVLLYHVSGHFAMVNGAALAAAHIDEHTQDPPAGTIGRDAGGRLTGILKEAAVSQVVSIMPAPTEEQREAAVRASIEVMHSEGMTGVKDPDLVPEAWEAYVALARNGSLGAHVCGLIHAGATVASAQSALETVAHAREELAHLQGSDLAVCGVKIFFDGAVTARTAWMTVDYPADAAHPAPTGHGYPTVEPDVYRQMIQLFTKAGVPVGTHVIGDRGIDVVVDAYADALAQSPHVGLRHSLIHATLPTEHALAVMSELERRYDAAIPETQAEFLWKLGDGLATAFTPERAQRLVPLASYARRGILYAGGSDYPVTPLPARYGLWASVAREPANQSHGAHPFGLAEAADVHAALRSYTLWGARQLFIDQETGSLEAGKWADIAVWDRNPYTVPADQLKDMRCVMTFYEGKQVF